MRYEVQIIQRLDGGSQTSCLQIEIMRLGTYCDLYEAQVMADKIANALQQAYGGREKSRIHIQERSFLSEQGEHLSPENILRVGVYDKRRHSFLLICDTPEVECWKTIINNIK